MVDVVQQMEPDGSELKMNKDGNEELECLLKLRNEAWNEKGKEILMREQIDISYNRASTMAKSSEPGSDKQWQKHIDLEATEEECQQKVVETRTAFTEKWNATSGDKKKKFTKIIKKVDEVASRISSVYKMPEIKQDINI